MTERLVMHQNMRQEVVITTVDKLRICLLQQREYLASSREWVGFAGLTLSLIATLLTSTFQSVLLKPETWQAIYIISAGMSIAWTVKLIVEAIQARRKGGLDKLIDRITNRSNSDSNLISSVFADILRQYSSEKTGER